MFKSWTIEAGGGLTERRNDIDPDSGRKLIFRACNHCRVKKLKCTGNRSGCQRCRDLLRTCNYDPGGIGRRQKQRSRRSQDQNSTSDANDSHHEQRLFALRADDETTTTLKEADGSSTVSKIPVQELKYPNQGASQTQPSQEVQSQASYCATVFSHSSSATDVSAESWDAGSKAIASPYHFDDFLATVGDTPSFPMDLVALENTHCEAQRSVTQQPPMSITETPPVNDNCLRATAELHALRTGQQQQMLADAPYGSIHVSNPTTRRFAPCLCLHRVILIMDEVELVLGEAAGGANSSASTYKIDVVLATHREALRHAKTTLDCNECRRSIETMTILAFLVEKLARICHRMAAELGEKNPTDGNNVQVSGSLDIGCNMQPCGFGSYVVESWEEGRLVVSKLVELQLCGLRTLVKQLAGTSQWMNSDTMARRLAVTDQLVSLAFSLLRPQTE